MRKFLHSITDFVDWFIPESVKRDEEAYRKSSILAWICVGVIVLCSFITISDVVVGNIHHLVQLSAFTGFLILILILLRKNVGVSFLGNLLMAVSFAFTLYLMYESGGLVSPLIIYLMIVPAFVVLIAETRWVVIWIGLSVVAVAAFYWLHQNGKLNLEIPDESYYLSNSVANYISAIIFIAVLFLYSETARRNARAELLVSKKRSDDLLLNVLPEQTAKELKDDGHSPARLYESATVMFTDFKGFTAASSKMDPSDLLEVLNEYFMHFDRIIDKHGIEKIKTIGDSYMAVGGLPTPDEDHAKNVVLAALEIRDWIERTKEIKAKVHFDIRIGVHSGPVVAGIVGSKKFAYDIWGDTVNTASRMESSGEPGKVNISQHTYDLVKNEFKCEFRGEIEAKGKGKIEMYFVDGLS